MDLDAKIISIVETKTDAGSRDVHVDDATIDMLRSLQQEQQDSAKRVGVSGHRTPMCSLPIRRAWI